MGFHVDDPESFVEAGVGSGWFLIAGCREWHTPWFESGARPDVSSLTPRRLLCRWLLMVSSMRLLVVAGRRSA